MKKSDLAGAQIGLEIYEGRLENATQFAINSIEGGVTLLANVNPEMAIEVISQLQAQVKDIEQLIKDNDKILEQKLEGYTKIIPDVLEFEEE